VDPIIDEETFGAMQEEKKKRSNYNEDEGGRHRRKIRYSSKKTREDNRQYWYPLTASPKEKISVTKGFCFSVPSWKGKNREKT